MIISKDLFLLGEQDYLRLPKDEKRRTKSTSNATGNGAAAVAIGHATGDCVTGGTGGGSAIVSSAAIIASTGMRKIPNEDLR